MKKILFVSLYSDELGKSSYGSVQRTENIIRSISSGHSCDLALITRRKDKVSIPDLSGINGRIFFINGMGDQTKHPWFIELILPILPKKEAKLLCNKHYVFNPFPFSSQASCELKNLVSGNNYDVIVFRYFWPLFFTRLPLILSREHKIIVDVDDDPCELFLTKYNQKKKFLSAKDKLFRLIQYFNIRRMTLNMAKRADLLWLVKHKDFKRFRKINSIPVFLPNIPQWKNEDSQKLNLLPNSQVAVFVGKLDYLPNKRGLFRFLQECWTHIKDEVPLAALLVVGKGLDVKEQESLKAYTGVQYLGFVEDLESIYKRSRFTIAPIYQGAGSKIKILESYTYGKPCITTSHGYLGVSEYLQDNESILVGKTVSEMVSYCVDLYLDDKRVVEIAKAGYGVVRKYYNPKIFTEIVQGSI